MTNELLKLKSSLVDAIQEWGNKNSGTDGWEDLETYLGDSTYELMGETAFNILLAQSDLTKYLKKEDHLNS